jgi:tripartite-type tricarboxylate transporter receptor subunit TctC
VAESLPGYEFTGWMGFLVPARVSRKIVDVLHDEAVRVVFLPDIRQKLQLDAAEPVGSTPEEFAAHLKAEVARWTRVVKATGIKAE